MKRQPRHIDDQNVWLSLEKVDDGCLRIERFIARSGESWCVYGGNHSGLDRFVDLFRVRDLSTMSFQSFSIPQDLGMVSFKDQQDLFEREVRNDDSDFLDHIDPGTPAREFLSNPEDNNTLIEPF